MQQEYIKNLFLKRKSEKVLVIGGAGYIGPLLKSYQKAFAKVLDILFFERSQ